MIDLKIGELFSGPGGFALGAHLANAEQSYVNFEHSWAVDNHQDSCNTFIKNIPNANSRNVFCQDVRQLDVETLLPIDIFTYGFPCNDFSQVGEKKGIKGKYGPLYTYGINVINRFKPLAFIAENVGGMKSANDGRAYSKILHDLKNAGSGYNLTEQLYSFDNYGVPQKRQRIIIVGIRKDLNVTFIPPLPTTKDKKITVIEVLEGVARNSNLANNELTKQSTTVIERLKYIKAGENAWTATLPSELQLNVKGARLSHIYKRLDPHKPAYTVTATGGGGTHVYHWAENRALTNRERARLQSFPDNFIFEGNKESVRRQIGMAVPPIGAKEIFKQLAICLSSKDLRKHVAE